MLSILYFTLTAYLRGNICYAATVSTGNCCAACTGNGKATWKCVRGDAQNGLLLGVVRGLNPDTQTPVGCRKKVHETPKEPGNRGVKKFGIFNRNLCF